ncbi:MAG TPA: ABC transporter permease, partial [Gemmatimonadaceae bacterium]|nr:ABC transporter permease [Gemmatimonadaceae bacterium]
MPFLDAIRLALAQIRVQKLKSFFTLLGVTIGVMFLIAVVSIVEGMSSYMEHDFVGKLVGVNTVSLRHIPEIGEDMSEAEWREMLRRPRILITDVEPVVNALPPGTMWSAEGYDNVSMSSQWAKPTMLQASAVEGDYFQIREMKVDRGRVITSQEMALGSNVIVIGTDIAERFFPKLDPLNRQL